MNDLCGTCGTVHADDGRHELSVVAKGPRLSEQARRLASVGGAVVVILVLVRLVSSFAGFSEADGESALPVPRPQVSTTALLRPVTTTVSTVMTTVASAAPRRSGIRSDAGLDVFLTDRFGEYRIIYESATGLGLVSDDVAVVSDPVRVEAYAEIRGFELFSSRKRTWAIDPNDPLSSFVVTNKNVVVETETPGNYAFIDHTSSSNEGRPLIGVLAAGLPGPSLEVSEGASALAVDRLGVLLATDDGTQLLRGARLQPFSDHRVLAARSDGWAERRCVNGSCRLALVVVGADGQTSERSFRGLSVPEVTDAILSPDLEWLIFPNGGAGQSDVWNLQQGYSSRLPMGVPSDASWSPDSQFFGWVERGRLIAVFPATGEVEEAPLPFDAVEGSVKILSD